MKIIKRSGQEAVFDEEKIINAVRKANKEVNEVSRISEEDIKALADSVTDECAHMGRSVNVEEIQDMVEDRLMDRKAFVLARKYITYRYSRALVRKANTTDAQILTLIECNNEEVKQENSNKN
ncbi:MAG TPA: anaerobic ribonucleoside-triphosphate reductase, partial [Candidatus Scatosoma pullicola]|nr:anaerobic ribonucleoside-triphosphate reductase [Candidatus Scatosoma pullicola]